MGVQAYPVVIRESAGTNGGVLGTGGIDRCGRMPDATMPCGFKSAGWNRVRFGGYAPQAAG